MKRYSTILAITALAALIAGCSKNIEKEAPAVPEESENLITVSISADISSVRASLSDSHVLWAAGDEIAVHDGVAVRRFTLASGEGTTSGIFTGEIDGGATTIKALSPYSAASWNGSSFDYVIPEEQNVGSQSIDPAVLIASGSGTVAGGLTFSNQPALLRFTVEDGVTRVIFHSRNKEALAGTSPAVFVTLPGTAGTYEVAINPGTYAGLRAFVTNGSGTFLKEGSTSLTLAANQGKPLGTIAPSSQVVVISTPAELVSYLSGSPTLDGYICKDLDLTSKTVTTCDTYANNFDGQFHSISNWESDGVALFGTVSAAGSVNRLTIESSCSLENPADGDFGFVVKYLSGTMTACINKADISVTNWTDMTKQHVFGPIVGRSSSTTSCMTDCVNYGNVDIEFTSSDTADMDTQYLGGLVGMTGTATDAVRMDGCRNEADHITVIMHNGNPSESYLSNTYVGGIVGATGLSKGDAENTTGYSQNYGTYTGCVNNADVTVTWEGGTGGYIKVGGIVGVAQAQLLDCVNNGDVTFASSTTVANANACTGGIAAVIGGPASPNAKDCTNNGTVSMSGSFTNSSGTTAYGAGNLGFYWASAGGCFGVVGDNATLVDNCDCNAPVNFDLTMTSGAGSGHCLGGIAGISNAELVNCDHNYTSSPSVLSSKAQNAWVGGIVGLSYNNVTDCTTNAPKTFTRAANTTSGDKNTLIGGVVGRLMTASKTISGCSNSGAMTLTTADDCKNIYFAGVLGITSVAFTLSNCHNSGSMTLNTGAILNKSYLSGIVSSASAAGTISGSDNSGPLSLNIGGTSTSHMYVAGILAFSSAVVNVTSCDNTNTLSVDGNGNTTGQLYMGGIGGYYQATTTFKGCSSTGDIIATNWNNAAYSYIGGIAGQYSGANNIITDCTHDADMTITTPAKIRVGGIEGAHNGTFSGNTHSGNITATGVSGGAAAGVSQVGGFAGYWGKGNIANSASRSCSVSGAIVTNLDADSRTGGVIGSNNVDTTWTDLTVNTQVTTNGSETGGSLLGGFQAASKTVTLAGTCTFTGTTVNGAAIASGNLAGYVNSGSFSGYSD